MWTTFFLLGLIFFVFLWYRRMQLKEQAFQYAMAAVARQVIRWDKAWLNVAFPAATSTLFLQQNQSKVILFPRVYPHA